MNYSIVPSDDEFENPDDYEDNGLFPSEEEDDEEDGIGPFPEEEDDEDEESNDPGTLGP